MMINVSKFNQYRNKLTAFYPNHRPDDSKKIWIEAIINPSFMTNSLKWIDGCAKSKTVDKLEHRFKDKFDYIKNAFSKQRSESTAEKIERLPRELIHFILLENFVEENIFVQKILNLIKTNNPNNYLEIIAKADRNQKSCKSLEESLQITIPNDYAEEIRFYLLLKKWQDIMHFYYMEIIIKEDEFLEKHLLGDKITNNFYTNHIAVADMGLKNYLKTKVVSLSELSLLNELGFENVIKEIYGGKSYGLVVLKQLGCAVPDAFVVPAEYVDLRKLKFLKRNKHYAVRSSANIEDGSLKSFAGMFRSFLNISSNDIADKIQLVRESTKSDRVKAYLDSHKMKNDIHMAVIIQEFEDPTNAGVWFGTDTNEGMLEYVDGDGEKLVSGHKTPTREIWATKEPKDALTCKDGKIGTKLLKIQNEIVKKYNVLPDIEWCIVNNQLRFVQFRPITTKTDIPLINNSTGYSYDSFVGTPCSAGVVSATCQLLESPTQLTDFKYKNILLAMYTDPDWLPIMEKSAGVATAIGGFLCHSAIICRELGIPCVVGVGMDYLENINNQLISLNGTTGEIKLE